MKLSQRLNALVENPHLKANKRDHGFAMSLLQAYQRQGRLTPGRRPWLDKLEIKYSEAEVAKRASGVDQVLLHRLERLLPRTEERSWNQGFVESILGQLLAGSRISSRQLEIITKIEGESTDQAVSERETFATRYNDESTGLKEKAIIASKYYNTTEYFLEVSRQILNNEEFVPTFSQYNKLVENKYAKKILAGYYSEPKFAVGTLVQTRSTAPYGQRNKKAIVVGVNHKSPTSACVGNKVYELLPIGETSTIATEERNIKTWRTKK
ncbi:MAG: hypothetical protein HOJ16_01060 [Candidatus Peribacter sp.]|nr:hypothetical protein [Candidatus Peribacter sp.]